MNDDKKVWELSIGFYPGVVVGMRSYHDDLVMALAIGCWVRDTALEVNKKDLEYSKVMLNSLKSSKSTMNMAISGMIGYKSGPLKQETIEAKEKQKEFLWLLKG